MGWLSPVSPEKNKKWASISVFDGVVRISPTSSSPVIVRVSSGLVRPSRLERGDEKVGEGLCDRRRRQRTVRAVPLGDPVDGAQHGEPGQTRVDLAELAALDTLPDQRPDAALEPVAHGDVRSP